MLISGASAPPMNPDTRPLPPGWVAQFDPNYRAWYYIDTQQNPPQSTWCHPAGPLPGPPAGAPPAEAVQPVGNAAAQQPTAAELAAVQQQLQELEAAKVRFYLRAQANAALPFII